MDFSNSATISIKQCKIMEMRSIR